MPEPEALAEANLYAVCELIAARAARPSTRRQYAGIFGRFCDALRAELGRPPTVADLAVDAIAGYARLLEREGGRDTDPSTGPPRRAARPARRRPGPPRRVKRGDWRSARPTRRLRSRACECLAALRLLRECPDGLLVTADDAGPRMRRYAAFA